MKLYFKSSILAVVLCLTLQVSLLKAQQLVSGALQVGASKAVMNPPENILTSSSDVHRHFSGIHDSLYVRSLVIDNGDKRVAMVSLDISKVPGGTTFISQISQAVGLPEELLFISATHNHNTVQIPNGDLESEHYQIVKNATIRSIQEAISKLQPARMGYRTGKAYINTNRDEKIGEAYHMGYNPEGPTDNTVAVLTFFDFQGAPIAVYSNYPVHAVVMYRATTKNGLPEITGDLPGYTARYVEERLPGAVALWTSGAAGDLNPIFMATYNQDHPDVVDQGPGGYSILDVQSRRLGEEIVRLVQGTKDTTSKVQLWAEKATIACPGQQTKYPRDPNVPRGGYLAPSHYEMVDADPVRIPIHLLMINDIALTGVAAEVFSQIGVRLKKDSPFQKTMMVTVMANSIGYVPTDEAYLMPSEKAIANSLKPGCAEPQMISKFIDLMNEYLALRSN